MIFLLAPLIVVALMFPLGVVMREGWTLTVFDNVFYCTLASFSTSATIWLVHG
jgi:hypothetical protein